VLDDGTGTLVLLLWHDLAEKLDDRDLLASGAKVSVRGLIAEYQGKLEIVPQDPADVTVISPPPVATTMAPPLPSITAAATWTDQPVDEPTAQPTPRPPTATMEPSSLPPAQDTATPSPEVWAIGTISRNDIGRTLTLDQAGIASLDYFSSGVKYTLSDGSGTITLLIWQNLMEEIPDRYDLIPGSQVGVTGRIEEYEGDLEIIPERGNGVRLLRRGERLPIEARRAADITPSDEGRVFTVAGSVSRAEGDGWLRLWVRDDSGEILVFVPQRTVPYLPTGLGAGARLRVTGEVEIYRGSLEIIPLAAADVEVP
jgi:DNA/RNA endonuclease YhcR with UshA esterase domain